MKVEVRGQRACISGYVNAVERDSKVMHNEAGPFIERAQAGVFRRALEKAADVELRFNHGRTIGSVQRGNLKLKEDAVGLHAEAEITDPEAVREARAGNLTGWSFGFHDLAPTYDRSEGSEIRRRTLTDIDLEEVSILTISPAYIATSIEARSEGGAYEARSMEDAPEVTEHDHAAELAAYRLRKLKLEE